MHPRPLEGFSHQIHRRWPGPGRAERIPAVFLSGVGGHVAENRASASLNVSCWKTTVSRDQADPRQEELVGAKECLDPPHGLQDRQRRPGHPLLQVGLEEWGTA